MPWPVKTHWCRVLSDVADILFVVSHIFHEGNIMTDALAVPGMMEWVWPSALSSILSLVNYNFYGVTILTDFLD